jgi:hypothetical protein
MKSNGVDEGSLVWNYVQVVRKHLLEQGQTQGSTLQQHTNKTLTTDPFDNAYKADEVSPEVEAGVVVGLKCLQPIWDIDM